MGLLKTWLFLSKTNRHRSYHKDGILFDGSSVDGFVDINDSDLVIKPDPDTFSTLPWRPEEKGVPVHL